MNPKLFIILLSGVPLMLVIYIFYSLGIHNNWQLFLFIYAIVWCIMPSLIIIYSLNLFEIKTKLRIKDRTISGRR